MVFYIERFLKIMYNLSKLNLGVIFLKQKKSKRYLSRNSLIIKILAAVFAFIFAGSLLVQVIAYR